MVWKPPFELTISEFETYLLESYIPKSKSDIRLYNGEYHEAKIESALRFAPYLTRIEAWALSMYLGPTEYYASINKYLRGKETENPLKYKLIAKAATIGLIKIPPINVELIKTWTQPNPVAYESLKRYGRVRGISQYQANEKIREKGFVSTTYWQDIEGMIERYAVSANVVFRINPNPIKSEGRFIDPIKLKNQEGEILFPPGVEFQVTEVLEKEYFKNESAGTIKITYITMDEL